MRHRPGARVEQQRQRLEERQTSLAVKGASCGARISTLTVRDAMVCKRFTLAWPPFQVSAQTRINKIHARQGIVYYAIVRIKTG
jgi:uncharacterized protein (DUF1800 family)